MLYLIIWLITLELIGLLAFLHISKYFPNLQDLGFSICKPLAMVLLGFISWLLCISGIVTTNELTLYIILVIFLATLFFNRTYILNLRNIDRDIWGKILTSQIVFLITFCVFSMIKYVDPSINHTEQPMDFAFLNASINAPVGGPLDPWMSGNGISYYYFGYWIFATVANLSMVPASYAYNFALITIPALSASAIYGLFININEVKRTKELKSFFIGLAGATIALNFLGNLYGIIAFIKENSIGNDSFWKFICLDGLSHVENSLTSSWYPESFWWWFKGTRIINYFGENCDGVGSDYTISEFPFFSYVLGDLHPHVIVIPFFITAILLMLSSITTIRDGYSSTKLKVSSFGIGLLIAACAFINLWSLPICLTVYIGFMGLAALSNPKSNQWKRYTIHILSTFIIAAAFLLPYFVTFQSSITGFYEPYIQTQLQHGLIIWAPLFIINIPFVIQNFVKSPVTNHWKKTLLTSVVLCSIPWCMRLFTSGSSIVEGPSMLQWACPLSVLIFITLIPAITMCRINGITGEVLSLMCIALSLTLILIPELFFVGDLYHNRMNTVFKFYNHAWILLSLSSGFILFRWCKQGLPQLTKKKYVNWPIYIFGTLIILSGIYYSAAMFTTRYADSEERGFDGLGYLSTEVTSVIKFAQDNISVKDVLLESVGEWDDSGLISRSTGIPNIINWPGHQKQWRGNISLIDERVQDVNTMYSNPDVNIRTQLLQKYGVSYVYIGTNERNEYTTEQLLMFDILGEIIYQDSIGTKIYRIE